MVVVALFEIVVWLSVLVAVASDRAWVLFACVLPVALFRAAVSVSALLAKPRDKPRDKRASKRSG